MTHRVMRQLATVLAAVCLASQAALAQYHGSSTASLGRSYGRTSLMIGNLSLGRQALKRQHPGGSLVRRASTGRPVTRTPAEIEAALGYVADPQLSERIHTSMIALLADGKDPTARAGLEKDFADDRVLKEFAGYMADNGFSSRNVADFLRFHFTCATISRNAGSAARA
jgi:hypothetical protein